MTSQNHDSASTRFTPTLHTPRLCLRPIALEEVETIHHLWIQPEIRRFLWDDHIISQEQVASILDENNSSFATNGFGLWGVFAQDAKTLMGFCGFWYFRTPPELELLFGIAPDRWGQGLATEAASALIQYGFDVLGFDRIVASADATNHASIRVMEKLEMQFEKRAITDGLDTVYYSISRSVEGIGNWE